MVQIYLLSVIANLIAGALLAARILETKVTALKGFVAFVESRPKMRLTVAIVAFAVGILVIMSPIDGDVPVVGDLLPAAAGLFMGYALWLEWFRERRPEIESWPFIQVSEKIFLAYRDQIGLAGMAVAFLHFLVPTVLFL